MQKRRTLTGDDWRALVGHIPREVSGGCHPADFERDRTEPPIVKWRKAVLGPDGPPNGTTRFVLLVLGTHMDEQGASCFPSTELLANETRISKRAIMRHLQFAALERWITVTEAQGHGKGWKRNEYQAMVPYFGGERASPRISHREQRQRAAPNHAGPHGGDSEAAWW